MKTFFILRDEHSKRYWCGKLWTENPVEAKRFTSVKSVREYADGNPLIKAKDPLTNENMQWGDRRCERVITRERTKLEALGPIAATAPDILKEEWSKEIIRDIDWLYKPEWLIVAVDLQDNDEIYGMNIVRRK